MKGGKWWNSLGLEEPVSLLWNQNKIFSLTTFKILYFKSNEIRYASIVVYMIIMQIRYIHFNSVRGSSKAGMSGKIQKQIKQFELSSQFYIIFRFRFNSEPDYWVCKRRQTNLVLTVATLLVRKFALKHFKCLWSWV